MQYNLTRTQIRLLLDKDDQFRADMTEVLATLPSNKVVDSGSVLDVFRQEIRVQFPNYQSSEKIAAIKHARERVSNWRKLSDAFIDAGYDVYTTEFYAPRKPILGLASAKKFVESC